MNDVYLNKAPKFFYFRTRIFHREKSDKKPKRREFLATEEQQIWEKTLSALAELQDESGIEVYGLVLDKDGLHVVFSTPYFNENILVLDWEMRLKRDIPIEFARPILCEPVGTHEQMKALLIEIYGSQLNIESNQLQWRNPFNSLKLIFDGHRKARLFKDPLRVVFQPSLVFEIGKHGSHSSFC
tara:strand:+ start:35712 stop:36263 length:552 start_codon:yes stop_codon:yes gene_type:complete